MFFTNEVIVQFTPIGDMPIVVQLFLALSLTGVFTLGWLIVMAVVAPSSEYVQENATALRRIAAVAGVITATAMLAALS